MNLGWHQCLVGSFEFKHFGSMAGALSQAEKIGKLNPELQSLLDARRVDPAIQAALFDAGVDTMGMLAAIAISRAELQTFAKDVLGVDPSAVAGDMVRFATVFLSWQSASNRIKVQDELNSELAAQKQLVYTPFGNGLIEAAV